MTRLIYLMDEICAGVEIYYSGRIGQQYLKTAFILCDDYTELTSKMFLLAKDPNWSDTKANGRFKNYRDVQRDVRNSMTGLSRQKLAEVTRLQDAMVERRERRNHFFHSTSLLDLNVAPRSCVEAFCDLLDYGRLLFGDKWDETVPSARNLDVLELLLRLENKGFSDPSTVSEVSELMRRMPRNHRDGRIPKEGVHVTKYGEDLHFRLCVVHGGPELRDGLNRLLMG